MNFKQFLHTFIISRCHSDDREMTSSCLILQDPQAAIPKGTLLAILITGITYLGVALCVCEYNNQFHKLTLPLSIWI